ncbi:hypothetical protein BTA51_26190 [Hahella sp. CCB-MM4]|uniref:transporter substrate-binding domain-containing protein n=1 Tax=Hahella sp. (strain CCB-MM4) TaxID=1926491 RepID=UPI000B9A4790|nr:transporter substrate-binding domain-containing protein [Hahella sp. CCB-MM4]OZG70461.1 hypothetical protein BTA51_26190 [Hahella sp. CCB-MM4]
MTALKACLKAIQAGLLCLAFQCSAADSDAKHKIHWLMVEWPPYTYIDQDKQWRGYGAHFLYKIIEQLPEYQHELLQSKFSYLTSGKFVRDRNVCAIGLYPTLEREEVLTFSLPDQIFPPMQLWMRDDTFIRLGKPNYLSLNRLMEGHLGILGVKAGVAYSPELRTVITRYENTDSVLRLTQAEMTGPLVGMLHHGRIDFMIEYSDMMQYTLSEAENRHMKNIVPVSIEEEKDNFHYTRIGCPKTSLGQEIIDKINVILPSLYVDKSYWEPFMKYMTPQQLVDFDSYLKRLIKSPEDWRYSPP